MNTFTKLAAAGLIAVAASTAASAANFSAVVGCDGGKDKECHTIYLSGPIELKDDEKFNKFLDEKKITRAVVILSSPGGYVKEGLSIGYKVHEKGFVTFVPNDNECSSMCAAIWVAGSVRYAQERALIGFHSTATKVETKNKKGKVTTKYEPGQGWSNSLVGAYYARMGLSDEAIVYATKVQGNQGILWAKTTELESVGVKLTILPTKEPVAGTTTSPKTNVPPWQNRV